jgi:hypothetical protein
MATESIRSATISMRLPSGIAGVFRDGGVVAAGRKMPVTGSNTRNHRFCRKDPDRESGSREEAFTAVLGRDGVTVQRPCASVPGGRQVVVVRGRPYGYGLPEPSDAIRSRFPREASNRIDFGIRHPAKPRGWCSGNTATYGTLRFSGGHR